MVTTMREIMMVASHKYDIRAARDLGFRTAFVARPLEFGVDGEADVAYSDDFDMVQIPVLPLPTPLTDWVHGMYCDEFAEWQIKDMPARQLMGSFVPSNGVGTGWTRWLNRTIT